MKTFEEALAALVTPADEDAEQSGVKGMKWGVKTDTTLGVANLAARGARVVTVTAKADGAEAAIKTQKKVAVATHNIAKQLSSDTAHKEDWGDIAAAIDKVTGPSKQLTAKNLSAVNKIVADGMTKSAQKYAEPGTAVRVMASHSLNAKMNPQKIPMVHLIVGKNKEDVDGYVDEVRSNLNGGKPGTDPNKNWIVHANVTGKVEVLALSPIVDPEGIIRGIKDPDLAHVDFEAYEEEYLDHSGVKGMKWGVRRKVDSSTGLVARTSSADQIHADRIASKIKKGGTGAVSNRDLKDFASRIQAEQEFNRANSTAEAQKGQHFITKFLATQGKRQFNRVADKAIDIAVEKALESAGVKVSKKNKDLGEGLTEIAGRLKPKKKGKSGS